MANPNWIAGAVQHPGALRRKAAAAGQSTGQFAAAHDTGNSTTAKQSRLAETLAGFHKDVKRRKPRVNKAPNPAAAPAGLPANGLPTGLP
jgi:hypothetical protein